MPMQFLGFLSLYLELNSCIHCFHREFPCLYPAFNPSSPDIKIHNYSHYCSLFISYGTSKENLSKYQDILSLEITFFILFI